MKTEEFECKRILLNGKNVEYYDEGGGQPIVLIHGWMYSKIIFLIIMKKLLRDGFRVIVPDMPGFGNSEELDDVHSPENYSEFLDRFVSKLRIKKFVLFGPSMGGTIALSYTINHKEKVHKLIVQAPFFYGNQTWFNWKLRLLTNLTGTFPLIRDLVYKITVSPIRIKNEENFLLEKIPKKYSEEIEQIAKESEYFLTNTMSKRAAEEIGRYTTKIDFRSELSKLSDVKTLIIRGDDDKIIKLDDMKLLNELIPNSKLIRIPDSGHRVLGEKPDETSRIVIEFLRNN